MSLSEVETACVWVPGSQRCVPWQTPHSSTGCNRGQCGRSLADGEHTACSDLMAEQSQDPWTNKITLDMTLEHSTRKVKGYTHVNTMIYDVPGTLHIQSKAVCIHTGRLLTKQLNPSPPPSTNLITHQAYICTSHAYICTPAILHTIWSTHTVPTHVPG